MCVFVWFIFISYLMSEIIWRLFFSTRLNLLDILPSRSIHGFVANGKISFLFYGWVMFACAPLSSVDGLLASMPWLL